MDRRPLWPPAPPPTFTRTSPSGRSRSSWTTIRSSALLCPASADPELFMNVVGFRSVTSCKPRVIGAASAFFLLRQEPPCRRVSSSATRQPTLLGERRLRLLDDGRDR